VSPVTTLVPAVLGYLTAACQASAAIGSATPPVTVIDGPHITDSTLAEQLHLWVGYDPLNPAEAAAVTTQDWPLLDSARTADETGEVTCAAEAWGGGDVTGPLRDQCHAIVGAVDLLLRGSPQAGGPGDASMGGLVFWSRVAGGSWFQRPSQDGISVMCIFRIAYMGRLTS